MNQIIILHQPSDQDILSDVVFPSKHFAKFRQILENMAKGNTNGYICFHELLLCESSEKEKYDII